MTSGSKDHNFVHIGPCVKAGHTFIHFTNLNRVSRIESNRPVIQKTQLMCWRDECPKNVYRANSTLSSVPSHQDTNLVAPISIATPGIQTPASLPGACRGGVGAWGLEKGGGAHTTLCVCLKISHF